MDLPQLTVHELTGFIASQAPSAPLLLDVREGWEVQTARLDLPGATTVHIPMHSLPARHAELGTQQPVLVLCHHGARSLQCVAYLQQLGHGAVYNIAGGIDAWSCEVDASVPRY
jgi:rhodanese-related sulfurtransferase